MSACPAPRWGALLLVLLAGAGVVAGGEIRDEEEGPLVNFVFASQLGSGVYKAGDRYVQVYRIPISYTVRSEEDHAWGVKLNFPMSLGFYDFETGDIFEGELPDSVSTGTWMAGAEFPVPLGDHWVLRPMAEIGYARDFLHDIDSVVYSAGLRSEGTYPYERRTLLLTARVVWAGQSETRFALDGDFLRLQTAAEVRHPLPFHTRAHRFDVGTFVANHLFFDSTEFFRFPREITVRTAEEIPRGEVSSQWEIGLTLGLEPAKFGKVPFPRLGFSYRFGSDVSAVRFVIGAVF